jgi:hypothetical protein
MTPALIIAAINGGIQLINLAMKTAEDLKQSGELTAEESKAFDAEMEAAFKTSPHWQPEA